MNEEFEKVREEAKKLEESILRIHEKVRLFAKKVEKYVKREYSREVSCDVENAKHGLKIKIPTARAKLGDIKKGDVVGVRRI